MMLGCPILYGTKERNNFDECISWTVFLLEYDISKIGTYRLCIHSDLPQTQAAGRDGHRLGGHYLSKFLLIRPCTQPASCCCVTRAYSHSSTAQHVLVPTQWVWNACLHGLFDYHPDECARVPPQQKGRFDVGQAALRDQAGFFTRRYLFYF